MKRTAVVAATVVVAVLGFLLWQRIDVDCRTFRLKATATYGGYPGLMWESGYGDFFF